MLLSQSIWQRSSILTEGFWSNLIDNCYGGGGEINLLRVRVAGVAAGQQDMRQDRHWGGELCIQAAEELADRHIRIFSTESATPTVPLNIFNRYIDSSSSSVCSDTRQVAISYHGKSHYNSLVPLSGRFCHLGQWHPLID